MQVEEYFVDGSYRFSMPFTCESCGYSGNAYLDVKASASAVVGATRKDATVVADERAGGVARKNAARLVNLVPCPECHQMSAHGLRRWRNDRVRYGAVFFALTVLGLVAAFTLSSVTFSRVGWGVAFACALGSIQFLWQAYRPPSVDVSFAPQ